MSGADQIFNQFEISRANANARELEHQLDVMTNSNACNLAARYVLLEEIRRLSPEHPSISDKVSTEKLFALARRAIAHSNNFDDVRRIGKEFKYEGGFDSPQGIKSLMVYLRSKGVDFGDEQNFELDELVEERERAEVARIAKEKANAEAKWQADLKAAEEFLKLGWLTRQGIPISRRPTDKAIEAVKAAKERAKAPQVPAQGMRPTPAPTPAPEAPKGLFSKMFAVDVNPDGGNK